MSRRANRRIRGALLALLGVSVLAAAAGHVMRGRMPDHAEISPELLKPPAQTDTDRRLFSFDYLGNTYHVRPLAKYDLRGLVVSHNDIDSFFDLVHDSTSVDTKDLGVIWGDNLKSNDFHDIHFENTDTWLHCRVPRGKRFLAYQISNNHLITDNDDIRDVIEGIRVGDQVRVQGLLVSYQDVRNPSFWRTSSLTRKDTGDGACEVVFVERIDILEKAPRFWYALCSFGWWGIKLLPVLLAGHWVYELTRAGVRAAPETEPALEPQPDFAIPAVRPPDEGEALPELHAVRRPQHAPPSAPGVAVPDDGLVAAPEPRQLTEPTESDVLTESNADGEMTAGE